MLLQNLRARMSARLSGDREAGFTLIELLVVMLILGILAAIAIPAFFNQRDKATDADTKTLVRTAQTAMETYATDNGGVVDESAGGADATPGALVNIEGTLADAEALGVTVNGANAYTVQAQSETGTVFSITSVDGIGSSSCSDPGEGGCPTNRAWAGPPTEPDPLAGP